MLASALAAIVLALIWPAFAAAGTVVRDPAAITYTADPSTGAPEEVAVGLGDDGAATVRAARGFSSIAGECSLADANLVRCTPAQGFVVHFLGFDDHVYVDGVTGAMPLEAHGRAGRDLLSGTINADRLFGDEDDDHLDAGPGADLLDGGPGGDGLVDGPGDDTVAGGPANDYFDAGAGRDSYAGGEGLEDQIHYESRTAPVTITLDGQADDGEAGEGDNAGADIEQGHGGAGGDRIAGNQFENVLHGNAGDDSITAGAAADGVFAGPGNDVVDVRDGGYDQVLCGEGLDTVIADQADSLEACEVVTVPDADGDGFLPPADCDNTDASRHPRALDAVGDGIDQDCDGRDQPPPRVINPITYGFRFYPSSARLIRLTVQEVQRGDRIEVRCRGRGCAFKKRLRTGRARRTTEHLVRWFKGRRLRRGAVIEVRITRERYIGKVLRLRIGRGRESRTSLCLPVGSTRPKPCV
jgi:hypothetical protein